MRFLPFLSLGLAACASATAGSSPRPSSETVRVQGAGTGSAVMTMSSSDGVITRNVAAPPDQVWRLMPAVLDSLGIPVNTLDAAKRTIGNSGFNIRGKLKSVPLSRYIDCGGATQMGPNADSYQVNLQFLAEVRSAGAGSAIVTTFQAVAKPVNFAQDWSACSSKGTIETKVTDILSARLPK